MNQDKIRSVFLAAIMVLSVAVGTVGVASAATTTTVSLEPSSQSGVTTGNTVTYDVVVDSVDGGVGSYEFTVNVNDTSVARITDVSLVGSNPGATGTSVSFGPNNGTLEVAVASGSHDNGRIATITVSAESAGDASLDMPTGDVVVGDTSFSSYTISGTNNATISVPSRAPDIQYSNLQVSPTDAVIGEQVTVSATVSNNGNAAGDFTANLNVDGSTRDSQTGSLDPGNSTTVEFTTSFSSEGSFDVTINGLTAQTVTVSKAPITLREGDALLDTDSTFWQGQELYFDASGLLTSQYGPNPTSQQRTFQVRRVSGDNNDNVGNLVDEFTVDSDNLDATIDTANLDGFYVVTHVATGQIVKFNNGRPSLGGSTSAVNADNFDWEVAPQTISTSFDSDDVPVKQEESATLEISSNRGSGYIVNVSAQGLDSDDLNEIWGQDPANQSIQYTDEDDDVIGLEVDSDEELEANFSVFDEAGSYTFEFSVADSTASDTASLQVQEKDVDVNFGQNGVFSQQVGDTAEIVVNFEDTDSGYVFIGGQDTNFLERIEVVDDDGDGTVTLEMNTFNAHQVGASTYDTGDDDDQIESVTELSSTDFANPMDNSIDAQPLNSPLEAGDYDIFVSSSAEINVNSDGELNIPDETDVGTLDLTERSTMSIQTWTAPTGDADEYEDAADILAASGEADESDTVAPTQTDNIALSDRLIVQVKASGIYGYLQDDMNPISAGINNNGLDLTIEETEESAPANANGATLDLSRNNAHLYTDADNDTFFVVVDMRDVASSTNRRIQDGDEMNATFSIYGAGDEVPTNYPGSPNPYVDEDEKDEVATTFTVEDADADFDNLVNIGAGDEELQVPSESGVTVSGTTNVAPGTDLTIRLRATGDTPFFRTQEVTVTEQGTFSTTFDMSDIPTGVDFNAKIRMGGTDLADVDGQVVEQVGTPTPTPPPTPEPETVVQTETVVVTQSPAPSPEPETRTVVKTQQVTKTIVKTPTSTPGQPGFGVTVAIVALLAAALLALRRRD